LGSHIFQAQACNACHSSDKIGPSVAGLIGTPRPLHPGGEAVQADEACLARSIRAPAADSLCGYPPVMPAYPALSDFEIAALLAYIGSLPEPPAREDRAAPGTACAVPAPPQRAL
jgi:cytochrome c oxidase subunit 2